MLNGTGLEFSYSTKKRKKPDARAKTKKLKAEEHVDLKITSVPVLESSECCLPADFEASKSFLLKCRLRETPDRLLAAEAFLRMGARPMPALSVSVSVSVSVQSFLFGDAERLYGGIESCASAGVVLADMEKSRSEDTGGDSALLLQDILCCMKRHFVFVPEPPVAASDFPLLSTVLAYVRQLLRGAACTCTYLELLVVITAWDNQLVGLEPYIGGSLAGARVAVEFVNKTDALGDAVFPYFTASDGVNVPKKWAQTLCETAFTASTVKKRDGYDNWRCQFANMGPWLAPAHQYFRTLIARGHGHALQDKNVFARQVFAEASNQQHRGEGLDVLEASLSGARLPIAEYANDFSWMFTAAAILARCTGASRDSILDAAEAVLGDKNADASSWGCVFIPEADFAVASETTASVVVRTDETKEEYGKCESWPLLALQQLILKDATVRYRAPIRCRFDKKNCDFMFERSDFLPPATPFGAGTCQLGGVLPALTRLAASGGLDVVSATVTASILLHQEVNDMFTFADTPLRSEFKDRLKQSLGDCLGCSCFHLHEGSFLTHASSALWAWMFERTVSYPEATLERTSLRMMALACQASVQYPELEQLALWTALVRLCDVDTKLPELLPRDREPRACHEPVLFGKLSLALARDPLSASPDAFKSEEDVHMAHVQYVQAEACIRASACLSRHAVTLKKLRVLGHRAFRRALVERAFLHGNWAGHEGSERALKCALFGTDDALEAFLVPARDGEHARGHARVAPHIDAADDRRLSHYLSLIKHAVDNTRTCSCRQVNATLFYLQPQKHLETIIENIAVSCVIWE